ncbi:MAG: WD40/YVTN/BNR-like repeat-containing protein [bacterium]
MRRNESNSILHIHFHGALKSKQFFAVFTMVICSLLFGKNILAQTIPNNAFSAMRWRNIGPFRAGRALAATGIAGTFYFGAVDGGIWKTTNAGVTWEPIADGQMNPSIGALAIASSNEEIMYAGTGEADMRSDITYGDGMYKSTDGGKHWQHIGLEDTRHIGKILIGPHDPDLVLVAAVGHAYGSNQERGVFRTSDGGKNWHKVLYNNPETGAVDLAWDPKNPAVVYAAMWQMRRLPWDQYQPEEGPGSGLYKSLDQGKSWTKIPGQGLPEGPFGRIGLAVVWGSGGQTVFAIVRAQKRGSGLYRSDDGGDTWRLVNNDQRIITRMWYFGRVFVDPQNANIVYIPSKGLLRSTDGGKTFTVIKSSPGGDDYHYLWIDPTNSARLIVASDQGTVISLDNGRTWSSWYNQPTAQFYHVTTDNKFPYRVYGSQQDAGTVSIISRSDYGEITFRDWQPVGGGESGYIAVDPQDPNIVYGGNVYGDLHRFDRTTGQFQIITAWPLREFARPLPKRKYRFGWTPAVVFDPLDPASFYLGAQMLLQSRDGGLHWDAISPDLTGARSEAKTSSKPLTIDNASARGWGVIFTIAPSLIQSGLIWVGTDDGLIRLTRDGGQTWQNVTPAGLEPWSKISLIEASPFEAGVAYLAIDRHRVDDFSPYIYKTADYGQHWTRVNRGIDEYAYVHVVRADPYREGLLYAGTELGVSVSFDDGANWQSLQNNLPTVAVRDIAVHDNDLVAATHGRAFWILDDVTPLQQMSVQVLASPVHLFRPERAIRIRRSVNTDTPLPPEIPHGANPPAGAIIDYWLKVQPADSITLDILDAAGKLVRHFSSADQPQPPERPPYFMDAWLPRFEPLTTHLGHNRFVWNLHYMPPPTKHSDYSMAAIAGRGTVKQPQGPLVLPGQYQIRLTVAGNTYQQSLKVEMDPRVQVSEQVLKGQLKLALQIWNAIADQHDLDTAVNELRGQLRHLQKSPDLNSETKSDISAIEKRIDSLNNFLNDGRLASLETVVMSADREPAQQMQDAFQVMNTTLEQSEQQWKEIKSKELAILNKRLKRQGLSAIQLTVRSSQHLEMPDAGEKK